MILSKFESAGVPVVKYSVLEGENLVTIAEKMTIGGADYVDALRDGNNLTTLVVPVGTVLDIPEGWLTDYWHDVYSGAIKDAAVPSPGRSSTNVTSKLFIGGLIALAAAALLSKNA